MLKYLILYFISFISLEMDRVSASNIQLYNEKTNACYKHIVSSFACIKNKQSSDCLYYERFINESGSECYNNNSKNIIKNAKFKFNNINTSYISSLHLWNLYAAILWSLF